MKNWKLLLVFGLIATLFVFAGCIAGTTTPETPTATSTETATPTASPTPWAGAPVITKVSYLGAGDSWLNIAEAGETQTVEGTAPERSEVFVYIDEVQVATGKTDDTGKWVVTITPSELQKLEDGEHTITAKYSLDSVNRALSGESNAISFKSDQTAPTIKSATGKAGEDTYPGILCYSGVTPNTGTTLNVIDSISGDDTATTTSCHLVVSDKYVETGTWYVTAGDFDHDGVIDDVAIRSAADPTNQLELYSVLGNAYDVTLPGSNNVVHISFGLNEFTGGAGDKIEVLSGYVEGKPGYISINFSEDVTLKNATQRATISEFTFWVDNRDWDFVVVNSITNPEIEALSNYHSTWNFEEMEAWWTIPEDVYGAAIDYFGYTQCDVSRQFSGFLKNFEDEAGNPAEGSFQGVFIP